MQKFEVTIGRPGGGSGTAKVIIHAASPQEARDMVKQQNPGYVAQAVKSLPNDK